jgi:hypothetical protein
MIVTIWSKLIEIFKQFKKCFVADTKCWISITRDLLLGAGMRMLHSGQSVGDNFSKLIENFMTQKQILISLEFYNV